MFSLSQHQLILPAKESKTIMWDVRIWGSRDSAHTPSNLYRILAINGQLFELLMFN